MLSKGGVTASRSDLRILKYLRAYRSMANRSRYSQSIRSEDTEIDDPAQLKPGVAGLQPVDPI